MTIAFSVPGKTILMGEHAAVFGCPALVAAIDRRLTATATSIGETPNDDVVLDLPQISVHETTNWEALRQAADESRTAWNHFRVDPSAAAFQAASLSNNDPAYLVKLALGEAAGALQGTLPGGTLPGGKLPGLCLHVTSEIPFGAGCGSSAALSVAVIATIFAVAGRDSARADLQRLSLEVERRQHGTPSGVDNATVIHGGIVWAQKTQGGLELENTECNPIVSDAIHVYHTGSPAESTGDVVAAVRPRLEGSPLLDQMEEATRALRREIRGAAPLPHVVRHQVRVYQRCLEEIGAVPEPVRAIVRQVEARRGAAKISGAGALSGDGAGALLVFPPEGENPADWPFLEALEPLNVRLGAPGIRREP